ncbi:hypothetical protein QN362_15140, partial [Actimicrobium sp. CCC2.4]|uniref:hypothetical protein n=1 Tax=Actimicrobium sp. CCC2.4 TaxID=3048606 RepID=UPI002B245BB5
AVAFFLVTLFLAKQKEVTGCRAAPGLVVAEHIKHKLPTTVTQPKPTQPNPTSEPYIRKT